MTEVDNLFGMAKRPDGISAGVTGVSRGCSVTARERASQFFVADIAAEASVANALKLAIPTGAWHPDFELNVGVRSRLDHTGDSTEGGQLFEWRCRTRRRRECAGSYRLCCGDCGVWKLELGELLTGLRGNGA